MLDGHLSNLFASNSLYEFYLVGIETVNMRQYVLYTVTESPLTRTGNRIPRHRELTPSVFMEETKLCWRNNINRREQRNFVIPTVSELKYWLWVE